MVLIFTEEQKKEIEENGYWVIQIKQALYKAKDIVKEAIKNVSEAFKTMKDAFCDAVHKSELIKAFNAINGKRKYSSLGNITIPKLSRGTFSGGYYPKYFHPKETEYIGRMPSIGNKEKVRDCYDKNRF